MANSHLRCNSTIVTADDNAMTSLELWRHAADLKARQVPTFRWATPPNSEVRSASLLHFKPILDPLWKKIAREIHVPGGGALAKLGHSLARVNFFRGGGAAPPRGRNMVFQKRRFRWVRFHVEISKVTGPKFTGLVSANAGGIAVDKIFIRFWISSSVP